MDPHRDNWREFPSTPFYLLSVLVKQLNKLLSKGISLLTPRFLEGTSEKLDPPYCTLALTLSRHPRPTDRLCHGCGFGARSRTCPFPSLSPLHHRLIRRHRDDAFVMMNERDEVLVEVFARDSNGHVERRSSSSSSSSWGSFRTCCIMCHTYSI